MSNEQTDRCGEALRRVINVGFNTEAARENDNEAFKRAGDAELANMVLQKEVARLRESLDAEYDRSQWLSQQAYPDRF